MNFSAVVNLTKRIDCSDDHEKHAKFVFVTIFVAKCAGCLATELEVAQKLW
jgi:hypothetical protein